jgi:hypothetical protein
MSGANLQDQPMKRCMQTILSLGILAAVAGCSSTPKPDASSMVIVPTNHASLLSATGLTRRVEIVGDKFYFDKAPLLVKGSFYEYHPVGKNPWEVHPPADVFRKQIRDLKAAGFNCIRWFNPTREALRICEQENMLVFVQFWVDQNGDFSDARFRADAMTRLREVVRQTRGCTTLAGYLVMNEPYLHTASSAAEIDATMSLLTELRDMVKQEDPGAYVSFVSWPSLAWLDYSSWDFVCFNVYTWSPVLTSKYGMGYRPFVEYLKKTLAQDKPLIVMEYGVSVGPYDVSGYGYGGYSEDQQAAEGIGMLRDILAAGAAGAAYTHLADQIWKVGSPAEQDDDPEEWFGMMALDMTNRGAAMAGRWRPVYYAHRDFYRAVLLEPAPCSAITGAQRIFLYSENAKEAVYRIDDGRWHKLEHGPGPSWTGTINSTSLTDGLHHVEISAEGAWDGKALLDAWVVVANRAKDPFALDVKVTPSSRSIQLDEPLTATISVLHLDGTPATNATVSWSMYEHRYWNFDPQVATTRQDGTAAVNVETPREPGWITISAGVEVTNGPYHRRFGGLSTVAVGVK